MCYLSSQVSLLWWWRLQSTFAPLLLCRKHFRRGHTHTALPQGTAPGLLGSLGWALLAPRASEVGALRNAMKEEGLWPLIQIFWLPSFTGCSHNSDLETYFSTDGILSFKGSFATVKIDHFSQKAAAGLCLFPNSSTCPVLCLLLLCLICLSVLHTWLARPFSFPYKQLSCFWQSLFQLSPQAFISISSFPRLALRKQSFRSS